MFIHSQIQLAALELADKYDLSPLEIIGEMNHAAWELSVLNEQGIENLRADLESQVKP